jgi:hypothetical protein
MRLPTVTSEQARREDTRAEHERWYQAFLDGTRLEYPTNPLEAKGDRLSISSNPRAFWAARGFIIHTALSRDRRTIQLWLGQKRSAKAAA